MTPGERSTNEPAAFLQAEPGDFGIESDEELDSLRAEAREAIQIEESREDVNAFAEYAFKDAASGEPLRQAPIHRELQAALDDPEHLYNLVEISRDHGKTTQLLIREIWKLGRNPERRSKIVCENDRLALRRLKAIREHIEKNERVHRVFPHLKPGRVWDKSQIQVERKSMAPDPSIEACGVTSAATGGRADELVFDDPIGRRNTLGVPALRNTVREAYHSDWLQLLEPDGRISIGCTGWTTDDLIYDLKQNPSYRVMRRPCEGFRSPWAEKWTEDALRRKRELVGSTEYGRGFELIPLAGDVVVVQPEWIQDWSIPPDPDRLMVFTGYDLSTGEGADFFACVNIGVDLETGFFYVLSAWRQKITFLLQVDAVIGEAVAWSPDEIDIEATQYQAALPHFLRHTTTLPLIRSVKPHLSKLLRLLGITPLLESGRVFFNPALNPAALVNPRERGDLVSELCQFPLAAHDDLVDAFVYPIRRGMEFLLQEAVAATVKFGVTGIGSSRSEVVATVDAEPLPTRSGTPKALPPGGPIKPEDWAIVEE
jgi:phage terminase large subunit-like protein